MHEIVQHPLIFQNIRLPELAPFSVVSFQLSVERRSLKEMTGH